VKEVADHDMEFGSHTKSHTILTQVTPERVEAELRDSKQTLEEALKKRVCLLSYPNGNHDQLVVEMTREAGYIAAFSCLPGINYSCDERYAFRRKHLTEYYSLGLRGEFSEAFFAVDLCDIRERIRLLRSLMERQRRKASDPANGLEVTVTRSTPQARGEE